MVAIVEYHQKSYIVIMLQAMNDDGEEIKHTHSIICYEDDKEESSTLKS